MKTHELAKILLDNPDMDIILQKDEEGNGYKPMRGVDFDCLYDEDNYEIFDKEWSSDDAGFDDDDWEEFKETAPTVAVFFPGWKL